MYWQNTFHTCELQNHRIIHNQVYFVSTIKLQSLVEHWQVHLPAKCTTAQIQFVA